LAVALGGRVERAEVGWRVGVQTYQVTSPLPWMTPPAERFRLIASHQDQVTVVPEGATVFAEGPLCPVAGLAYGSAMSFQGHPEYTPELSRLLTIDRRERIGEDETRRGLASLDLGVTQPLIADWIVQFVRRTAADRPRGA
jgi:GMP synthase-like glutamine amidotransferase